MPCPDHKAFDPSAHEPFNARRLVMATVLSRTADALINPRTVLAWLMGVVAAPGLVLPLLVPVREAGSMLPQWLLAPWVWRQPLRKRVWVAGALLQGVAVAGMAVSAATLTGAPAGMAILLLLVAYSIARSMSSIASKDVLGRTISGGRRGRVQGVAISLSGVCVIATGWALYQLAADTVNVILFTAMLLAAAACWWLAAALYAGIRERPEKEKVPLKGVAAMRPGLALLWQDRDLARLVATRTLYLGSALVAPYVVLLAQRETGGQASTLGLLILAGGLAGSLSAALWGRLADASARRVLVTAGLLSGVAGLGLAVLVQWLPGACGRTTFALIFLVLSMAHAGIRLGRKTYVVNMSTGDRRTACVAVSNTAVGVSLLVAGAVLAAGSALDPIWPLLGLSLLNLGGAGMALTLNEVQP